MSNLAARLCEVLAEGGAALVGFAELTQLPEEARHGLPRAVSLGVALDPEVIDGIRNGPTAAYYDLYNRVNEELTALADRAAEIIRDAGHGAHAVPATVGKDGLDTSTLAAEFPHKTAATCAGLGWIGKCALLITPEYGSALRFATVLTDAPLPTGEPVVESRCGECQECVDVCPGDAPSGKDWNVTKYRDEFFSAIDCVRGILSHETDFGYICGMCIAACPFTQTYLDRAGLHRSPEA